ncbi:MAG: hypothetical protein EOM88_01625 [Clostridia bacterium]|nr:hypothetical protein [Clostridia bacterium]
MTQNLNNVVKIIILSSLIFVLTLISTNDVQAKADTCTWRIKKTLIQGNTVVDKGCSSNELISKDENCDSETKPPNKTNTFQYEKIVCCCPDPGYNKPKPKADIIIPSLSIKINTVELSQEIFCQDVDCYYPWIAEYINGIYKYGFGIAGILAAIMLMAGGVIWLTSAGDASKIGQAKNLITGSVIGLLVLSTSYIILETINPELTNLKHITIKGIEKIAPSEVKRPSDEAENPYQKGCDASRKGEYEICKQYVNETPKDMIIIPDTSQYAKEEVVNKYLSAMKCVEDRNDGKKLFTVGTGWRSPKKQLELFESLHYPNAAYPCCSNHGKGTALDLNRKNGEKMTWGYNESSGLLECMNAQGLYAKLKGQNGDPDEPWHWSPSGR